MNHTVGIRNYEDSDFPAIVEIYNNSKLDELQFEPGRFELVPLDEDPVRWSRFKESDVYVFEDSSVIAYCALNDTNIEAIYVSPKSRRKGIAKILLEFLLSKVEGDMSLNVAKNNKPAITLYQKYGFEVESEFSTSYNGVKAVANKMVLRK